MNLTPEGLVGQVVGGYQLLRVLGSGGTGTVYLAAKVDAPDQQVAVKVLTPPPQTTPADLAEFKGRFQREAKALQLLQHPHILSLIAYGEDVDSGLAYMVLPHMAGGPLSDRLTQGGVPLEDAARYATQIADALDYAHQKGVVHRDLKPGNVLLDERGDVFLADFGIAKIFDTAGTTVMTLTSTGQIMGTADYMSPEQAQGQNVTAASDIYGFGMVLYHLITGKVAFEGKSLTQVLLQIATTPPVPPRRLRPELPASAEAAILKALSKQPVDRFKTAGELATAFTQGLRNEWVPGLRQAATLDAFVPQQTLAAPRDERSRDRSALMRPPVLIAGVSALLIVALTGTLLLSGVFNRHPGGPSSITNGGGSTATNILASATSSPTPSATSSPTPTLTNTANQRPPTGSFTEFVLPNSDSQPRGITSGPDGNLWITEWNGNRIGRVTTSGSVTEYGIPTGTSYPAEITSGPDGNLWFAENSQTANNIGRITPSGTITEFGIPTPSSEPADTARGSDGNIWFTEFTGYKIGRMTPGGSVTEFSVTTYYYPAGMSAGPDGNVWFAENGGNKIGRITPGGSITEFVVPTATRFGEITTGPDGALWFCEYDANKIGRITIYGSITEFPIPTASSGPGGITTGPDGNVWFTEGNVSKIGRITPGGRITEFDVPTGNSQPYNITAGADGNLWFTEFNSNKIARVTP